VEKERIRRPLMKKAVIALAAGLFLLACLPAFSQTQASPSQSKYPTDVYVKTVHIMKISLHQLGYKLQFWTSKSKVGEIYVPLTWFNKGPESKAAIEYGNDSSFPYFTIYWADGVFDHIQIHAMNDYSSLTWGVLESKDDLTPLFDIKDLPKEF
jgi:hypothetical protein